MNVIWIAPSRIIPNYGEAETNQIINLPDELAAKFIDQGEAKIVPSKKKESD